MGIPAYAINCLFGYLFMVVMAGTIVVMGLQPLLDSGVIGGVKLTPSEFHQTLSIIMLLAPWAFAFCTIMCPTAACSISLEGRASWICRPSRCPRAPSWRQARHERSARRNAARYLLACLWRLGENQPARGM